MKTSGELPFAVARTVFNLSALIRGNMWRGGLSALVVALSALHLLMFVPSAVALAPAEAKNGGSQQWSLRVDKVGTSGVNLDPSLESGLHKSLLRELAKTKRFKQVLLTDDGNTTEVPDVLTLKMTVQAYAPGSETGRTTLGDTGVLGGVAEGFLRLCRWGAAAAATKLNAHIQLYTRQGRLVLDNVVEGDIGFTSGNSRAARNLAQNVAITLKRSNLPDRAIATSDEQTANTSKYQEGKHQAGEIPAAQCYQGTDADARISGCEVSMRVVNTAYGVLYAVPVGTDTDTDNVWYETDRELMVP
jgi:hypothetical protein